MTFELLEIIEKLLGEIEPVGATHIDTERFENLNKYENLIAELVYKYASLLENLDRYEHSMKIVGERSLKFIKDLYDELEYYIEKNKRSYKMSKAEKMFNELGYEKTLQTQYEIIYKLKRHNLWRTITFKNIGYWSYSTEEKILIGGEYEYKGLSIYEPLHQAITQQMKELGWLE